MNGGAVWATLDALADVWRSTSVVETFAVQLPRNQLMQRIAQGGRRADNIERTPIAQALEHVSAALGAFMDNPFLLPSLLPAAASVSPEIDLPAVHHASQTWFEAAWSVEAAHRLTIEWLRSRLPRYPLLPAPQLAENTALTTREYAHRITWAPRAVAAGLQLGDVPASISNSLHADDAQQRVMFAATRDLHAALSAGTEWIRFNQADAALNPTSQAELLACRARLAARLTDAAQNAHEPTNAVRRAQFRSAVTTDELQSLTGVAAEYAEAFTAVDTLIELAAGTVFSQLACYPIVTLAIGDLSFERGADTRVRFTSDDNSLLTPCGSVVWLNDPLVEDAVFLQARQLNFGPHGVVTNFSGVILDGSRSLRP